MSGAERLRSLEGERWKGLRESERIMRAKAEYTTAPVLPNGEVPPLKHGDRLSRDEFERRYEAMPHVKKAELIEGVVYMPSPVSMGNHARPNRLLSTWLGTYEESTPNVFGGDNATARLDLDNEPQPDLLEMIDPACGGQAVIDEDGYVAGAPELVVEVAASSASIDLGAKLEVYRRTGVREYLVCRVLDGELDWFVLRGKQYRRLKAVRDGIYRSKVFPGLWLDGAALLDGDLPRLLAVLKEGMRSREHAAFVAKLRAART